MKFFYIISNKLSDEAVIVFWGVLLLKVLDYQILSLIMNDLLHSIIYEVIHQMIYFYSKIDFQLVNKVILASKYKCLPTWEKSCV